jgi:hypothetical protein
LIPEVVEQGWTIPSLQEYSPATASIIGGFAMSNATTTKQFSNDSGAVPVYIEKRLNRGYMPKNRFVIVKYRPIYYDSGKYLHNEWSSYSDIGRSFDDGVLSFDEYLMIEKRFISCIKSLAHASCCKYLTIGYLERRKRIKIKKKRRRMALY